MRPRAGLLGLFVAGLTAARAATADFEAARRHYEAAEYSAARAAFTEIAAEQGARPATDFYLGRIALWFDDERGAFTHLERAARESPHEARIQNALGDACGLAAQNASLLAKPGWARRCLAAYRRAVELEPGNAAWRWSLLGYHLIAPRIVGGDMGEARAQADAIRRLDAMAGRAAWATVFLAEKRSAAAFAEFEPLLRESPDNFLALYHVGRCAALSGDRIEFGIAALRRCLQLPAPRGDGLPSHACAHYRLGNLLERRGDRVAAAAEYARAYALQPDFRPAKITLKN